MKYGELTLGQIEALVNIVGGMDVVTAVLQGKMHLTATWKHEVFPIIIDYSQSLEQMIAAGKYDWKNDDITAENFPMTGIGIVNVDVIPVHLNRDISTENAEQELANLGLEPAKIEHLLAFGAKYPEIQREYPIVCLGSSWVRRNGDRCVPYLGERSRGRRLNLGWAGHVWRGHCRFLAVRKSQPVL